MTKIDSPVSNTSSRRIAAISVNKHPNIELLHRKFYIFQWNSRPSSTHSTKHENSISTFILFKIDTKRKKYYRYMYYISFKVEKRDLWEPRWHGMAIDTQHPHRQLQWVTVARRFARRTSLPNGWLASIKAWMNWLRNFLCKHISIIIYLLTHSSYGLFFREALVYASFSCGKHIPWDNREFQILMETGKDICCGNTYRIEVNLYICGTSPRMRVKWVFLVRNLAFWVISETTTRWTSPSFSILDNSGLYRVCQKSLHTFKK